MLRRFSSPFSKPLVWCVQSAFVFIRITQGATKIIIHNIIPLASDKRWFIICDANTSQIMNRDTAFPSFRSRNDRNGQLLSVVSALARLNVDPWKEAVNQARMPREHHEEGNRARSRGLSGGAKGIRTTNLSAMRSRIQPTKHPLNGTVISGRIRTPAWRKSQKSAPVGEVGLICASAPDLYTSGAPKDAT